MGKFCCERRCGGRASAEKGVPLVQRVKKDQAYILAHQSEQVVLWGVTGRIRPGDNQHWVNTDHILSPQLGDGHMLSHFEVHNWDSFTETRFWGSERFSSGSNITQQAMGRSAVWAKKKWGWRSCWACPGVGDGLSLKLCCLLLRLLRPFPAVRYPPKQ